MLEKATWQDMDVSQLRDRLTSIDDSGQLSGRVFDLPRLINMYELGPKP
jgi:hypothetical protein